VTVLTLTPGAVTLADLEKIFCEEASVRLDFACRPAIELAHARIAKAVAGTDAVYGVNTGFGNSPRSKSTQRTLPHFSAI
jgi:histidine ammonia-lyase